MAAAPAPQVHNDLKKYLGKVTQFRARRQVPLICYGWWKSEIWSNAIGESNATLSALLSKTRSALRFTDSKKKIITSQRMTVIVPFLKAHVANAAIALRVTCEGVKILVTKRTTFIWLWVCHYLAIFMYYPSWNENHLDQKPFGGTHRPLKTKCEID